MKWFVSCGNPMMILAFFRLFAVMMMMMIISEGLTIKMMSLDHSDGQFLTAMEWQWFFGKLPLVSMVFRWFTKTV